MLRHLSYLFMGLLLLPQSICADDNATYRTLAQNILDYTNTIDAKLCELSNPESKLPRDGLQYLESAHGNEAFQDAVCDSLPDDGKQVCTTGAYNIKDELEGLKKGVHYYNSPNPPDYLIEMLCETNNVVKGYMNGYLQQ